MLSNRRIAVVVPARDERARIAEVCATLPAFVDAVVVVDDASRDDTGAVARAAGGARTRVVRHEANRGVGAAIATGYREAARLGCDIAVVMAGDGQMDPGELEPLLAPLLAGRADYVKGERMSHPEVRRRMPAVRYWGSRVLSRLTSLALGVRVTDSQCGYTAITLDAVRAIELARLWPRYGYPNDLLARLACAGQRIVEVPVSPIYRGEKSGLGARHVVVMLALIARGAVWRVAAQR